MTSEMVNHVAFRTEALSTVLWTLERSLVVVCAHMDGKIVPIVECFSAGRHTAMKIRISLVVCKVRL